MKWKKLGRVFVPNGNIWWMKSHAYLPTPVILGNKIRVYLGFWDHKEVKRVGFVDLDIRDPTKVVYVPPKPCLDVGEIGTFDNEGVCPSFIFVEEDATVRLYYVGWQELEGRLPRYIFAGLARSSDGGNSFTRSSEVPMLDRIDYQRYIRSSCCILKERGLYHMWYTASNEFIKIGDHLVPSYKIYKTDSPNGRKWLEGFPCMDFSDGEEFGLSRPWVIKDGLYKMFYSIRKINKGYTLGYAISTDGIGWYRRDHLVGIEKSESGWDSEMVCFPAVLDCDGKRYMFYNGNNYGETGFGVAVLEEE